MSRRNTKSGRKMANRVRESRGEAGYSLPLIGMSITVMLAMLGLSVDLGRMYIVRNELQAFADEAAVAAAYELDGTSDGIERALEVASSGIGLEDRANRFYFSNQSVSDVTTEFAMEPQGPYLENPGGAGYRFVRVTAKGQIPMYFLPILPNVELHKTVASRAVAGQGLKSEGLSGGAAPFSPDAHDPLDSEFGFTRGTQYTLKWAPPGQRDKPGGSCAGDAGWDPPSGASDRGYIDVGQGNGNSALYDAIVNGGYYLPEPLQVGSVIHHVNGNKNVGPALDARYAQDSDTGSQSQGAYDGNGRRLLTVPVNDGGSPARVVGFATFMLPADPCAGGNNKPCCGIYLGPAPVLHGTNDGAGPPGLYEVRLYE